MASITLDADRRVRADAGRARLAAVGALRGLGFRLTTQMATVVEAQRGSAVRSAILVSDQVPLGARLGFTPIAGEAASTMVSVHLTDRSLSVVALGVQAPFVAAFQEVLQALDQALAGVDPDAAANGFPEPRWWARGPEAGALSQHYRTGQRLVGDATARISERLSGPAPKGPSQWSGFERLVFTSSAGAVTMDMPTARGLLAIPVLISARPGAMSPEQQAGVERLATAIEGMLNGGGLGVVSVPVPDEHREAFELLYRQFTLRSLLPVRTLCTCRACRQTKVVNLDLKRLRERNRHLKLIWSVFRATTAREHGEINPFSVFGAFFGQAKLDPDFLCSRCESTEADEQPVTFCPSCGDMCEEAVLTTCSACGHDFGAMVADHVVWGPVPPPLPPSSPATPAAAPGSTPPGWTPPAPTAPPTVPQTGPAATAGFGPPLAGYGTPRGSCALCGKTYPVLWSVLVPDGPARRQLVVCATSPRCSPASLVPPVQIRS